MRSAESRTNRLQVGFQYPLIAGKMADELSRRVLRIFERNQEGLRPVFGNSGKLQTDVHFKDDLLFHEYFQGDSGKGPGASHQTGWTTLIATFSL